jgi:hypothetical protein
LKTTKLEAAQPFTLTTVADHRLCLKAAAQPFALTTAVVDHGLYLKATKLEASASQSRLSFTFDYFFLVLLQPQVNLVVNMAKI